MTTSIEQLLILDTYIMKWISSAISTIRDQSCDTEGEVVVRVGKLLSVQNELHYSRTNRWCPETFCCRIESATAGDKCKSYQLKLNAGGVA